MKRSVAFSSLYTLPLIVLTVAAVALLAACPTATQGLTVTYAPLYTFYGDSPDDNFGFSVSGAGDVNGDGHADLIVGAYADDNNGSASGSAHVLSGRDGSTLYTFNGDSASDQFGRSVSGAGDVNGDGRADLIVGALYNDNNGSNSGSARVLSGIDGSIIYTFEGDSAGDLFGISVSGAGDVNGDGHADLIVGAFHDDNNGTGSGSARVLSGSDGSTLYSFDGDSMNNGFGYSVSSAGDVNGDGRADLIIGIRGGNNGNARVLSGLDGSILHTFHGSLASNGFGLILSVSGAGDINGDGLADLIVGARFDNNNGSQRGSARVLSGLDGSTLYTFYGNSALDFFGVSVSSAGDVNGDGHADLIVGVPDDNNITDDSLSGSVRILSGSDGSTLYTFYGDSASDLFGYSVSDAGDVNGDGLPDFIVGAKNGGINGGGYARVFVSQIIPEPSSLLLISFAIVGLLTRRVVRK